MPAAIAEPPTDEQPALGGAGQAPLPEANAQFIELAAAVRLHERIATDRSVPKRPADHRLYRLLTELERDDLI